VQLRHDADRERLARPDAEDVTQRVRVQLLDSRLHAAELERDVEGLGLRGENPAHVPEEPLSSVDGGDAEVRSASETTLERAEQRDPLRRIGGGFGEFDDLDEPLALHGLEDGAVGGLVRELHEQELAVDGSSASSHTTPPLGGHELDDDAICWEPRCHRHLLFQVVG
jgi:hypothetical protein